jgi:glycosyltransferase involved in cell wall biosynthesis
VSRHVLFVAHSGDVSGAESVLVSLAGLALERGDEVTVACPDGALPGRLPSGTQHLPLPPLTLRHRLRAPAVLDLARRTAAAAVQLRRATTPATRVVVNSLLALPAVHAARPPGGATWLVHDTVHRTDQRLVVRFARGALRRAVAVSRATAAPLEALGLPVVVRGNGVSWPVPAVDLQVQQPPVVGHLALITPWKGHSVVLDAVARLPGVRLELAGGHFPGDVAHLSALRRRAEQPDLRGRVSFLGHVDAFAAMQGWDVAVSASTGPEACPLSVLEALSVGLPVVGTALGGTVELLEGGGGRLVPPGDAGALAAALRTVLEDTPSRRSMAEAGRRTVADRHDLRRTLPAMLDALTES